ncbi:hypothetical protein BZM27_05750 [Paraburkholderia steynii]|uniref:Uncharacterized protein n=1 Tax=Paraburkholderia steynii TaxID=1245441 RepID=A0A4R0XG73_9BURK|nr:hypothetical protein BZM27_05750 [Paraburkholderia steynii]
MKTHRQIYRFLRFKHKFVGGLRLCRVLGISAAQLKVLDRVPGVGSFGPVHSERLPPIRYARRNSFCADFIAFFKCAESYYCIKTRPLVRGRRAPKAKRHKRYED